ncbi:MAG: RNA 2'-phosphotransferase [Bacteroidia bacterium]|jgi:putative RNA 2'-phosphotransferase|nr:RNA 2'-phosphotransferase [Bacteroidia bacterium]
MDKKTLITISKEVSYALRHAPEEFGITLDPEGWVNTDELVNAINARHKNLPEPVTAALLQKLNAEAEKQRWEFARDEVRALYGHSTNERIVKQTATPPAQLWHGTNAEAWKQISQTGLMPMNRQYVHLSSTRDTALMVGRRRTSKVIMLCIDTEKALAAGHLFYHGNQDTWLADAVPAQFITAENE